MAQSQKPTNLGYAEMARRVGIAGDASATCVKSIVGLESSCTASEGSTFANPGGATKLSANGFTLVNAATVSISTTTATDDTVEIDHVFTWTGTQSVTGFAIENDDDDVIYMECCFNAALAGETSDTVTIEAKMQYKLGS